MIMKTVSAKNISRLSRAFIPMMHIFHNLASEVVKLTDFSLAQYRVIMLVYRYDSMSINDLKQTLNIAQSTASEMIDRLVRQKALKKQINPADRRITMFTLTPLARRKIDQHLASIGNIYHKILTPLGNQEQKKLLDAFETILSLLQKNESIYKFHRYQNETKS
jgi:DNA-binding MarR family transcriptional regulator